MDRIWHAGRFYAPRRYPHEQESKRCLFYLQAFSVVAVFNMIRYIVAVSPRAVVSIAEVNKILILLISLQIVSVKYCKY